MAISKVSLSPQGLSVSRIIYGVWRIQELSSTELRKIFGLCREMGMTSFDHADIYGSYQCEEHFARCLKPLPRQDIQLISKCGIKLVSAARPHHRVKSYDTSAAHIIASVERSLSNLETDYLDLLLLHRPDPLLDADAVAEAVLRLRKDGKIRAFGVSNFLPAQFDLLQSRLAEPLASNQIEAHPLRWDVFFDGTLDHAQRLRYRPMIWSPLAAGAIANDPQGALYQLLSEMAASRHCSIEALLLAWLLRHPAGLVPVIGSTNPQRLQSIQDAETIDLDAEEWFTILQTASGREIP